jgi:biopolymer transport protein ExbB
MITTVGGLIVGILAYFGYNFLTSQVTSLVSKMEAASIEFLDAAQARKDNKTQE